MNVFGIKSIVLGRWICSFLMLLGMTLTAPASATTMEEAARQLEGMTWYTENYPPYNFEGADGLAAGMTIDILMAAFKKIGVRVSPAEIKTVPWNRSYKYVQTKPGTVLFSMTYTPEREKLVKFVGPALSSSVSIIAPKTSKLGSLKSGDLNELKIGVIRNDIGDQLVQKLVTTKGAIRRINSPEQLYALLKSGKVDVVAYAVDVFQNTIKGLGEDHTLYEGVYTLNTGQMGYAFHKSADSSVLKYLQQAIDDLKANGTIDNIIAKYRD